jgi:HemY protein
LKKALVILLVATALGAAIGTLMFRDPGYILVSYEDYAIETSLWFGVIVLLVLYFVLRFVIWLVRYVTRGSGRLGDWSARRRENRSRRQTERGVLLLGEGRWAEANKALLANVGSAATPLVNYLGAARAADALGDEPRRDEMLRLANDSTPGAELAVGLDKAQLQIERGLFEQALATLLALREQASGNARVLKHLAMCYQELGDWDALRALLPDLKKSGALASEVYVELERQTWLQAFDLRLAETSGRAAAPVARELWSALSREQRRDPVLIERYARLLEAEGDAAEAESILRSSLRNGWDERLVGCYGRLAGADVARQISAAERWLKDRPGDAALHLALGRLSLRTGDWSKAREYLESALKLNRSPECYAELGRLCNALGDHARGSELLAMAVTDLPELPLPASSLPDASARREGEHV